MAGGEAEARQALYERIGRSCLCCNLRRTARGVTQLYDRALRPAELRSTQFALLVLLQLVEASNLGDLAEVAGMDRTTLSRNLRVLERHGWVERSRGEDRRSRQASLTRAGQDKLEQAIPYWQAAQHRLEEHLGSAQLEELLGSLNATDEIL